MTGMIEARELVKTYRAKEAGRNILQETLFPRYATVVALNKVSISVQKNEIFGLLGTNGAGKSTLIRCLCGVISPDSGSVYLDNHSVEESKQRLGVMFSSGMLYHRITGYDNLKFFARLYGLNDYERRITELGELFGITKYLNRLVEGYSLGTKTRLAFARTLLHDPDILFLDEPTLGLDPYIAAAIRKEIRELKKTILVTTHHMTDAEELCNRISILHEGSIVATGTVEQLKKTVRENTVIRVKTSYPSPELMRELRQPFVLAVHEQENNSLKIIIEHKNDLSKLLKILARHKITKIEEHEPSLEDVFIRLTRTDAHDN